MAASPRQVGTVYITLSKAAEDTDHVLDLVQLTPFSYFVL